MSWKDEVRGRIDDCCFSSDYSWILMRILDHIPDEDRETDGQKLCYENGYEEGHHHGYKAGLRAGLARVAVLTNERDEFRDSLAEEVKKNDDLQRQLHAIREILK